MSKIAATSTDIVHAARGTKTTAARRSARQQPTTREARSDEKMRGDQLVSRNEPSPFFPIPIINNRVKWLIGLDERFFMGIVNGMRGRPKKPPDELKTASMKIPLADGEKELIERAAAADSKKPVTWSRDVLLRAAKRKA